MHLRTRQISRILTVLVAATAVALATFLSGAAAQSLPAIHSESHADELNDAAQAGGTGLTSAAADITTVLVSNDPTGQITFAVSIPGSPSFTQDMEIIVWIDSDMNPSTGDVGSDFAIDYWVDHTNPALPAVFGLYSWDGVGFSQVTAPPSLSVSYSGGVATLSIKAGDLGIGSSFAYEVWANSGITYDPAGAANYAASFHDQAPSAGSWPYSVITTLPLDQARLQGKFAVTEGSLKDLWSFKPKCAQGACAVRANIKGLGSFNLSRSGAGYKGGLNGRIRCSKKRSVKVTVSVKISVKKAGWVGTTWRATDIGGTMKLYMGDCKGGRPFKGTLPVKGKLK